MIDIRPFIQQGRQQLEPYLAGIDEYIADKRNHPKKGSQSLREKPPDSYVRNILAVSVLNHLCRPEFIKQEKRIIVLPDCLKDYDDPTCCKAELDGAPVCTQCNSDCFVFEAMERFADDHTTIVLEPDKLPEYFDGVINKNGTVGVVGVACILTLLSGYQTTLARKLPTQGVFLNYASCAHNWTASPYNTSFSYRRLAWVLNKDNSNDDSISFPGRGETYSLVRYPNSPDDFYARLDDLARIFSDEYLPRFKQAQPNGDLYDIATAVMNTIVPDLITRDTA